MAKVPFPEKYQVMRRFGDVIRDCRTARGLTQSGLAEISSIDRSYLANMEAGEHSPTIIVLWRLARALRVTPSHMIATLEKVVDGSSHRLY